MFALLGLLIAFTFSGASARFDQRRHLIVEETNAIGTAYLRIDLLPAAMQPIAVFVILDIEYPRLGLIRVDAFDQALMDLRQGMDR